MRRLILCLVGLLPFWVLVCAQAQFNNFPPGTFNSRAALDAAGSAPTFATWNPSDKDASITLSNGNLTAAGTTAAFRAVRATKSASSGKKYWEYHVDAMTATGGDGLGVGNSTAPLTNFVGSDNNGISHTGDGNVYRNGASVATIAIYSIDTVCLAFDLGANLIWWRTNNGNWNNNVSNDPATGVGGIDTSAITGPFFPMINIDANGDTFTANFGASAFAQTPPSGFGNW